MSHRSCFLFAAFWAFASLLSTPLAAYMPGRWSPLDVYVIEGRAGGPRQVVVSIGGKMRQQAELRYSGGRLEKESYYNTKGEKLGETRYEYKDNRLVGEVLTNKQGVVVEKRVFQWSGKDLNSLQVFDNENRLIMNHNYTAKNAQVFSGSESNGADIEKFIITYEKDRPVLQKVFREDGQEIGRITFRWDDGKLAERIREQSGMVSKCVYSYDGSGRLASFTYFNQKGKDWVQEKTLKLEY